MNKKTTRGAVAAVAGLGLVAVGMMPALTASAAPEANDSNEPLVSSEVTAQLEENGTADVWLNLADQADLSAAYDMSWEERGEFVYDTLRAHAEASQADLRAELDAAGVDYETFWINNSIRVEDASVDLVSQVTSDSTLGSVTPTRTPELIESAPVETSANAAQPQATTWGLDFIKAPEIWEQYDNTGEGVVVGTFDTGADVSHPALNAAYRGTETGSDDYNWFDSTGASDTPVDHGIDIGVPHGTHVTGTMIGADGDNEIGVAPGAQFIVAAGCCVNDAEVFETFEWFVAPTPVGGGEGDPAMRPDIVNNSWGFTGQQVPDPTLEAALDAWDASGIFGVFSSGNSGSEGPQPGPVCDNISSPAWNDGAHYVVANHQEDGTINPSSSRGPGEDGEPGVDIAAPGTGVVSAVPGDGYEAWDGTSMAAPHISGAVALLWSEFPDLKGDQAATIEAIDAAAIDQADPSCGGDDANNPTFGEGTLDLVALFESITPPAEAPEVERIGGEQRYETADLISDQFGDDVETVYIATGENFPDAVSGAPAAAQGKLDSVGTLNTPDGSAAPVLLVKNDHPNNLPGDTRAALEEIAPANIVVLGGESVISEDVYNEIDTVAGDASLQRIEGDNRYDTAANMATDLWGTADTVYVASGEDVDAWSDALTGGALAGTVDAPVLLTKSDAVPETTANALESLGAEQVIVLGGPATIDDPTFEALGGTERLGGANKFETAAAVAGEYAADVPVVYVASANTYPDALTSSALAGSQDVPVVVVKGTHDGSDDKIPAVIKDALKRLSPEKVVVVGGADAVDQSVEDWLNNPENWQD